MNFVIESSQVTEFTRLVCFIAATLLASPGLAQWPTIRLGSIEPTGAQVNAEIAFRVRSGTRTDEATTLEFSHPGITSKVVTEDPLPFQSERRTKFGNFRVHIAADVPVGQYEVRTVGRYGISNPRAFWVHAEPSQFSIVPSHTANQPTPLVAGVIAHSSATASEIDYYSFTTPANQAIQIDLYAARVDSRMLAQITLFDADGNQVDAAFGTDENDPQLVLQSGEPRTYVLAVHDTIFRGGDEYPYQLVLREPTAATPINLLPRSLGDVTKIIDQAKFIEESSDPQQLTLPCTIASKFDTRDDVDTFEFDAVQGDTFIVDLISQRVGEPTDARLTVYRGDVKPNKETQWGVVQTNDDRPSIRHPVIQLGTQDPQVTFKADQSTKYRLVIRDLDRGESMSKQQRYWIDIRKPAPSFQLIASHAYSHRDANQSKLEGSQLPRGGSESIVVLVARHDGFSGAVKVSVDGLPEGVTCQPVTAGAGRDQVHLHLQASDSAPFSIAKIRVIGESQLGDQTMAVTAANVSQQWATGNGRGFHRSRLSSDLVIAVSERDQHPVTIAAGSHSVVEVKKGESVKLPIKLTRREGGQQECTLRPRDLPPNLSMGEVKIAKDATSGEATLKSNANVIPGTYSLWLQCETKIKLKPNPQALERAEAYRRQLQSLKDDPANAEKLSTIDAAIATADANVNAAKGEASEREVTVFIPSPTITIRIIE